MEDLVIKRFVSLLVAILVVLNLFTTYTAAATKFYEVGSVDFSNVVKPSLGTSPSQRGSLGASDISKISFIASRPKLQLEKTFYSDEIQVLVSDRVRKRIDDKLESLEKEIIMLAQLIYTETGGIKLGLHHQAAVVWCVLNRVDSTGGVSGISSVIRYPGAFAWYSHTKVEKRFVDLAEDVVARWLLEQEGYTDVGRVLPKEYIYFHGAGGVNKFKTQNNSKTYWDWSLESPYKSY